MKQAIAAFGLMVMLTLAASPATLAQEESPEPLLAEALEPWQGDLDGIVERRMLRIATAYNPLFFAYNGEERVGLVEDTANEFQAFLEDKLGEEIPIFMMPLPRDQIIPAVVEGRADIAIANLTITADRAEDVAFSMPTRTEVSELVVTGPAASDVETFDDLVEVGLYLRPASSYYAHLARLNEERRARGGAPIPVTEANENLEDYDLLDMVNAGIVPAIVVDSHKAELWSQIFVDITVHSELAVNEGGEIGWAMRRDADQLAGAVNEFVETIRVGTLLGNILINRYLGWVDWIEDIRDQNDLEDFDRIAALIRTYAKQYEFDWLMILAQAYQESKLQQSAVGASGAVGVMQILPSTAADPNVAIENIEGLENNIHAGIKYLAYLRDEYFADAAIVEPDRTFLSLAAYNAGPANVGDARAEAKALGLDPNRWFSHVETAIARTLGQGPVHYVRNIYKYFVAYGLSQEIEDERDAAAEALEHADP